MNFHLATSRMNNMNNANNGMNANTVPINLNITVNPRDALFEQSNAICAAIRRLQNRNNSQKNTLCEDIQRITHNIIYGGTDNQLGMPSYLGEKASELSEVKSELEGTGLESMLDPIINYAQDSADSWRRAINGDMYDEFQGGRRRSKGKGKRKTRKAKKTRKAIKSHKN